MIFKSVIRSSIVAAGISLTLSTAPALAGTVGSMTLDITGGCFSYGANGAGGCDNDPNNGYIEYATGSYAFTDTLNGDFQQDYKYHATIDFSAGSINYNNERIFNTLSELQGEELWLLASSFVTTVIGSSATGEGSFTGTIEPPLVPFVLGPYTVSWEYPEDSNTGEFKAWSENDLNNLSLLLFEKGLPEETNFDLKITFTASSTVPEPATLALIGLGILSIGAVNRRRKMQNA